MIHPITGLNRPTTPPNNGKPNHSNKPRSNSQIGPGESKSPVTPLSDVSNKINTGEQSGHTSSNGIYSKERPPIQGETPPFSPVVNIRFRNSTGKYSKQDKSKTQKPLDANESNKIYNFNLLHQFNTSLNQLHQTFKPLEKLFSEIERIKKNNNEVQEKFKIDENFKETLLKFITNYFELSAHQKTYFELMKQEDEDFFNRLQIKLENNPNEIEAKNFIALKKFFDQKKKQVKNKDWLFKTDLLTGNSYILGTLDEKKYLCVSGIETEGSQILIHEAVRYFNSFQDPANQLILSASPTKEFMTALNEKTKEGLLEALKNKEAKNALLNDLDTFTDEMRSKAPALLQKILETLQNEFKEQNLNELVIEKPKSSETEEKKIHYFDLLNKHALTLSKHLKYDEYFGNEEYAKKYILYVFGTPNCAELSQKLLESKQEMGKLQDSIVVGFVSFKPNNQRIRTHMKEEGLLSSTKEALTFERNRCAACEFREKHLDDLALTFTSPQQAQSPPGKPVRVYHGNKKPKAMRGLFVEKAESITKALENEFEASSPTSVFCVPC